jgi:hypothetical protein
MLITRLKEFVKFNNRNRGLTKLFGDTPYDPFYPYDYGIVSLDNSIADMLMK